MQYNNKNNNFPLKSKTVTSLFILYLLLFNHSSLFRLKFDIINKYFENFLKLKYIHIFIFDCSKVTERKKKYVHGSYYYYVPSSLNIQN